MNETLPYPPIEVTPRDLSAYRVGNTGIDYVHSFDSGRPGPEVLVVGLTHGNEFPGVTALSFLLDAGIRPRRGRLTLAFANVEAYGRFDPGRPIDSRFVDRDMNRVWRDDILAVDDGSYEIKRARELRPFVERADALLDIHTTFNPVQPMLVYQTLPKVEALARRLREPLHHIVTPGGKHQGGLLCEYGRLGDPSHPAVGMVVECGQHFAAASGAVAIDTTLRFLELFEIVAPGAFAENRLPASVGEPMVYDISEVLIAKSDACRFVRPFLGFEELAEGEVFAIDGGIEHRAPYDRCTLIMPKRLIVKDREFVTLARPRPAA